MIIHKNIDLKQPLTASQIKMLTDLKTRPATPDEELPELTPEQLAHFKRVSVKNQEQRRKQTVTLRLSPQAVNRAKSLGKGYTSILSRIIEKALEDPETIMRNL